MNWRYTKSLFINIVAFALCLYSSMVRDDGIGTFLASQWITFFFYLSSIYLVLSFITYFISTLYLICNYSSATSADYLKSEVFNKINDIKEISCIFILAYIVVFCVCIQYESYYLATCAAQIALSTTLYRFHIGKFCHYKHLDDLKNEARGIDL